LSPTGASDPPGTRLAIVHVVAGLGEMHGGPSYSVPALCGTLARQGAEIALFSVRADGVAPCAARSGYYDRRFAWDYERAPMLRALRCSSGLANALRCAAPEADIVHNHGLWLLPNVQAGRVAAKAHKPLVISPRGMLAPAALQFSRLKKRVFWAMLQGPAFRRAACYHATSIEEYQEIRAFGLRQPIAIIPNGIDMAAAPATRTEPPGERTVLSLGRIHPKKGLDRLVRAWGQVEGSRPGWRLRIIGPAELGHDAVLRRLAASLGLSRVSIEGPIYGAPKADAYRDADIFVLPTLNENFGLTVAEALAAGTPVISTKGAPWSRLEDEGCGWWIDHGVEPLAAALSRAMEMPRETLDGMGARGRAWMAKDFSWERVGDEVLAVYRWLARGAKPPASVRFD
jgi:glycosyltransferase involved in cell wall biosynthesis